MTIDIARMQEILNEMSLGTYDALSAGLDFFTDTFIPELNKDVSLAAYVPTWRTALSAGIAPAAKISNALPLYLVRMLVLSFPPGDIVDVVYRFLVDNPSQRVMVKLYVENTGLEHDPSIQKFLS